MNFRKDDTVTTYLERKLAKSKNKDGIYNGRDLVNAKAKAVEHFSQMTPEERLEIAEFNCDYLRTTDKIGNLYYGTCRIWIKRDGSIYANRPKGY